MCNEKLWSKVASYLLEDFELIYLDIPLDMDFDEIADSFKQIIQDQTINLIGFSLGGYIATYFAAKFPQCIERLFVISNSPCELLSQELQQRKQILNYVKRYSYNGMSRKKVASMLDEGNHTESLMDLIIGMDSKLGKKTFISQYQNTFDRIDLAENIRAFEFYSCFYFSEDDSLVNQPWVSKLASCSPKTKVIKTSGSGHMLPLEKPLEFVEHIRRWMNQ
ncbi:alpha/beta hydrolase [Shewanella sp. OPT22]|nr:alpha/beta hydrolase [Shewanella sp. OPT22]